MSKQASLTEIAKLGVSDEFQDYKVYERLSKSVGGTFSETLSQLAAMEKRHMEFWQRYVPEERPKARRLSLYWIAFLRNVLGITFVTRYLDRHETKVIHQYRAAAALIPQEDKAAFDQVIADEELHERELGKSVETAAVQYISFIVLGLADALVEITGIHAGSLGIYSSTKIAGLAGVIAGGAASLAMSSAAFAQAKQGFGGSARMSAIYTGVSYFVTAVTLASPYFLTKNMLEAISVSLTLAVIILALSTYYSSIISEKPFTRDFLEIALFMFGVTVALYLGGTAIGIATGVKVTS